MFGSRWVAKYCLFMSYTRERLFLDPLERPFGVVMNYVSLPLPVVQLLRRLFNVISTISISNQYLLVRKAEAEALGEGHKAQNSSTASAAPSRDSRSLWQTLWTTKDAELLQVSGLVLDDGLISNKEESEGRVKESQTVLGMVN